MGRIQFDYYRVNARKDLLHFVEENCDREVYEHIGANPEAWIDELNLLNQVLTGKALGAAVGIHSPPTEDSSFIELGNNTYLYRGRQNNLRGLWTKKPTDEALEDITRSLFEWTHYSVGTRAELRINRQFSDVPIEDFLPDNFEKIAKPVKKEKGPCKRPIFKFPIRTQGAEIEIYAKGAFFMISNYYSHAKPKYRLTSISRLHKVTSKREMEVTLDLMSRGIKVPGIVGYYQAPAEEFLFVESIESPPSEEVLFTHRQDIIKQDAEMLADLCLAGYRKQGFTDFDDKVFDGKDLYLVDVEECVDLYSPGPPDFREILLDAKDISKLREFRELQKQIFSTMVRDAIFNYKDSLLSLDRDKEMYIRGFYQKVGWELPNKKEVKNLITFPENYMTHDSFMSMMSDTD